MLAQTSGTRMARIPAIASSRTLDAGKGRIAAKASGWVASAASPTTVEATPKATAVKVDTAAISYPSRSSPEYSRHLTAPPDTAVSPTVLPKA